MRVPTGMICSMCLPTTSSRPYPNIFSSVVLTSATTPSSPKLTKPHGALSRRLSIKVITNELDGLFRMTHMRTMTGRVHDTQRAVGNVLMQIITDCERRDDIVGTLQDQGRHRHVREVVSIVGKESCLGEATRDHRIRRTEALLQFAGQLRAIGILHDRRREK